LLLIAPCLVAGRCQADCDEEALAAAHRHFADLREARRSDPGSVSDEEFRAASQRYSDLAEACYVARHGPIEKRPIDPGGVWMPGSEPVPEESRTGE
jgi:hypothetical protein